MKSLIIRDICIDGEFDQCEVVDQQQALALADFARACGQSHDWVIALVQHSILEVDAAQPEQWQFLGEDLARAQRAWRLQRDFDASLTAVALMLDLLDEVKQLRAQVVHYSVDMADY
jgi:chaperone modulatory protein CbpM